MRLTKLGHSCVRLEKDGAVLLIDPGIWSGDDPLAGANAVLITHEHIDHLDPARVHAALDADAGLELWTTASVAAQFSDFGGREHAPVHPDLPVVANVGFTVDGKVFHPGDAFTIPQEKVPTLLLPISAPWLKAVDMIEYARAVAPEISYAIHDEMLNANGIAIVGQITNGMARPGDGRYARLEPGTSVEI
jgi:L-ascorbate metabolism protein UlaG (beta-lactamase superfamily)